MLCRKAKLVPRSSKPAKCGVGEKPAAKPEASSGHFAQAKSRRELQLHLVLTHQHVQISTRLHSIPDSLVC